MSIAAALLRRLLWLEELDRLQREEAEAPPAERVKEQDAGDRHRVSDGPGYRPTSV
jgi:hypothetical protein